MSEKMSVSPEKKSQVKSKGKDSLSPSKKSDSPQLIGSSVDRILFLQRTIGNNAIGRVFKSGVLQANLRIGHVALIQSEPDEHPATVDPLTAPLTDNEWQRLDLWLSRGEVGIDPLTDDADHNANIVAGAIFCSRMLFVPGFGRSEDPLLCLDPEVTIADTRVRTLKQQVVSRGPILNWAAVPLDLVEAKKRKSKNSITRLGYVMDLLVNTYQYPVNAAAGIVGNLLAESAVLPGRIERSAAATPMRAANVAGNTMDFSPEEVMNRSGTTGPKKPGIGLAQWTTQSRRAGLFARTSQGRQLGSSILFNMDAQVEYLVSELRARAALNASLTAPGITMNDASDNVVYQFEVPGSILDSSRHLLPRADPAVQSVFNRRRANAQQALKEFQAQRALQEISEQ